MTSILHPPRPPTKVAQRETKKPVIKHLLHKLGIVKHHPFSHLQSFHPPVHHPLSQEEKEAWQKAQEPAPRPKKFSIHTEEEEADFEKKALTLMRKKKTAPVQRKRVAPVDPKEFLKETDLPEADQKAEEFLKDTEEIRLRKTLTPLERFAKESHDTYARQTNSEWHETKQEQSAPSDFAQYEEHIEESSGEFAQGSTL